MLACHRGIHRKPFRLLHPLLHPSKSPLQRRFIRHSACEVGAYSRPADMSLGSDGNRAREGSESFWKWYRLPAAAAAVQDVSVIRDCVVLNRGGVNPERRGARRRRGWLENRWIRLGRGGTGGVCIIDSKPGDESQTRRPGTVCLVACLLRQVSGQHGNSEAGGSWV